MIKYYVRVLVLIVSCMICFSSCNNVQTIKDNKDSSLSNEPLFKIVAEQERQEEMINYSVVVDNEELAEFCYLPTLLQRPLSYEFNNNYVIGRDYIFYTETKELRKLNSADSEMVWDYSINDKLIATIEKFQGKKNLFEIIIKDIESGKVDTIDKFSYSQDFYPIHVSLDWGLSNVIYYDSCIDDVPVIMAYNNTQKESEILFKRAINPRVSLDKTKLLYTRFKKDLSLKDTETVLYDLINNKEIATFSNASFKVFWLKNYLIFNSLDGYRVYDVNTNQLIDIIKDTYDVYDIKIEDNEWVISYLKSEVNSSGVYVTKEDIKRVARK